MHVAETREELELLASGTGPLVDMLDRVGLWNRRAFRKGTRPMDFLRLLWFAPRVLVIHGNYLDDEELRFLGRNSHMSLVYCPRTHRYFQHPAYPLEAALRHGVRVALGTDSRASNPDLNLWEEAKAVAAEFPAIDPMRILEMATRNGAGGIGFGSQARHPRSGTSCKLVLCPTRRGRGRPDPCCASRGAMVAGAMHDGEWILAPGINVRLRASCFSGQGAQTRKSGNGTQAAGQRKDLVYRG